MDPIALLLKVLIAIFTFGVLVAIHEWGHFWVARRCGVKVLRFAIGFGPVMCSWHDKSGTEYAICALPLGGYVKMLDAREGSVVASELDQEFNGKHPWKRIAIASAGPLANFILAFFVLIAVFAMGTRGVVPIVGAVEEGTPSHYAGLKVGDEILQVDSTTIRSWQDVIQALLRRLGETGYVDLTVVRDGKELSLKAPIDGWLKGAVEPDLIGDFGLSKYRVEVSATLNEVLAGSAAALAGVQPGDVVLSFNGESVDDWYGLVDLIRPLAGKATTMEVERNGETILLSITPEKVEHKGEVFGRIGVSPVPGQYPEEMIRDFTYHGMALVYKAFDQLGYYVVFTFESAAKLFTGHVSVKNLSGPISIAKVASESASYGLGAYLVLLAMLSVSLGVLNLLPIPVLDGGHILFHTIEWIKGSPVSEFIQDWCMRVGGSMVLCLMVFALFNDLTRS